MTHFFPTCRRTVCVALTPATGCHLRPAVRCGRSVCGGQLHQYRQPKYLHRYGLGSQYHGGAARQGQPCALTTSSTSCMCAHIVVSSPACALNYFQASTAATTCSACPTNANTATTGSSTCRCNAGFAGSGTGNSLQCTSCNPGSYAPIGSTSCTTCAAGYFSSSGAASCTACPAGQYQGSTGQSACQTCPPGQISSAASASTTCSNCAAGYFSPGNVATCTQCTAGYWSTATSGSCTACLPGTYNPAAGSASINACLLCAAGTASGVTAATAVSSCQICPIGTYSQAGATVCASCPVNTYQDIAQQSSCKNCPAGYWTNSLSGGSSISNCTGACPCQGPWRHPCVSFPTDNPPPWDDAILFAVFSSLSLFLACPMNYVSSTAGSSCTPCQTGTSTNYAVGAQTCSSKYQPSSPTGT